MCMYKVLSINCNILANLNITASKPNAYVLALNQIGFIQPNEQKKKVRQQAKNNSFFFFGYLCIVVSYQTLHHLPEIVC